MSTFFCYNKIKEDACMGIGRPKVVIYQICTKEEKIVLYCIENEIRMNY